MKLNIHRMVTNLQKTTALSVLQETIVNSIQAKATNIKVSLKYVDSLGDTITKIENFSITDDGDGFTADNIKAFCEYGTESKLELGCKGIGRISFLKIFKKIKIESFLKKENKHITIHFDENFDEEKKEYKKETIKENIPKNQTKIEFSDILTKDNNDNFCSLQEAKEKIHAHLLPLLYFKKNNSINIHLEFKGNQTQESISPSDIPPFKKHKFKIPNTNQENIEFVLHYSIVEKEQKKLQGFYCANHRSVCRFEDKKLAVNPVEGHQIVFLLTSVFLNDKVDDERNDFEISPNQAEHNLFGDFSWEMINEKLSEKIAEILYDKFPTLKNKNKEIIQNLKKEYLHLADYLSDDRINSLGGLIDEEEIIKKAENDFLKIKREFRKTLEKNENNKQILDEARALAGQELLEYILLREKIIGKLSQLNANQTNIEENVRSLFLKRGKEGTDYSHIPVKENNLWLLDDKFMTYNYIASEKQIASLLKAINPEEVTDSKDRFDIGIYSNSNACKKVILIETKKLNANYKANGVGILQLSNYAKQLKKKGIDEIYLYLIAYVDDTFKDQLQNVFKFTQIFSQRGEIYQGTFDNINAYIQIISPDALIADAKTRNKTFLDMIREQHRQ